MGEFHAALDAIIPKRDPLAMMRLIVEEGIVHRGEKWYRNCFAAMKGADLVICHSVDIPAQEAAIRNGIPWFTVTYCPAIIKSLDFAPYPFPNWGRAFNAVVWKVAQLRLAASIDALFNQFIVSVGGRPRVSVMLEGMYSPSLNLIAASPTLCPRADFPPNHKFTGVWHLASPSYVPPAELVAFLEEGPPPVIITFGSMGGSNGRETTEILIDAVNRTNQRAIIQAGWGNSARQKHCRTSSARNMSRISGCSHKVAALYITGVQGRLLQSVARKSLLLLWRITQISPIGENGFQI